MSTTNFTINGVPYAVNLSNFPADITLNTFLREHAQLTSTKFMCLEGGCGVCVCVIKGKHPVSGELRTWAANSCLTLLNSCADWQIITSEGIGDKRNGYHAIQKRLAKMNGTQCGYCSPGFVMNMYALLESKQGKLNMNEIENAFGGNICRCTGYRPILDAMKSFAVDSNIAIPAECQDIEDLHKTMCCNGVTVKTEHLSELLYADGSRWHWPKNLVELFAALQDVGNEEFMLVAGNTAHGVYRRSANMRTFIDVNAVPTLKRHAVSNDKLTLGGNLSLSETMDILLDVAKKPGFEYCQQVWQHFDLIANVPVRNTGTLAGNIAIKKAYPEFPSDVFIVFEALDVQVIVYDSANSEQTMSMADYLKHSMPKSVLTAFELKAYDGSKFIFNSYKIMPRAQNAHAYVNAAFLLQVDNATNKVEMARLCFGGIHPTFTHAYNAEKLLQGQNLLDAELLPKLFAELADNIKPNEELPDASPEYRLKLACGLLYRFLLSHAPADKVKAEYLSGAKMLQRELSSGTQRFSANKNNFPVGEAVQKVEALIQCSGEATYMNDTLTGKNTLYCAFVGATKIGATIEEIDAAEALKMPGVVAFYSAKDIPGANTHTDTSFGYEAEEIFCASTVKYFEQPLGVVVANSSDAAQRAVDKVKVLYSKDAAKQIMPTMADVFAANVQERFVSIIGSPLHDFKYNGSADVSGKGIFEIGLQYHFTMEPQTTVAVPFEDGLQVWCATQWMDHTQCVIAKMLQLKAKDVQLKVRRLGGGYGSKISRGNQVACAACLVAFKLNRPVRFVQSIESMMNCNGKRWACRSDYEFHVNTSGKIQFLRNSFYQDAGMNLNENPIEAHSTICSKNCYDFNANNLKMEAQAVLTDAPSSTWCRAPGSVEGIAMIENIMEHIAFEANVDPADARLANIKSGNKMAELLPRFLKSTDYRARRQEIDKFNEQNLWLKRGLGLAIMEYPIFYFGQYSATVAIYHVDGTVVISHGGIEMGQGMNTKIVQVAAHTLGIPMQLIKTESSDTINGANSMVTGGAVGSESLCFAVRKACETLNERLKPVKDELKKNANWQQIVQEAYHRSINMIVSDHYKQGDMPNYNIYGLALTEMELDILTGNHLIKRVDILEDCGESLSPHIDIGQVEGGFVMCLGYWLTENLVYDRRNGQLLSNRTWHYKPPGAKDIPIDFRIELLQNNPNPAGFMRSKATGEPPCCLAVSSLFALQHALQSARKDAGLKRQWVRLGAPTTPETIVLNAGTDVRAFSLK